MQLVFVKHNGSKKNYLFKVPETAGRSFVKGETVLCDTRNGQATGVCATNSFTVEYRSIRPIMEGVGATLPLRDIVGYKQTKTVLFYRRESELPF